jgi:hypothetical protein
LITLQFISFLLTLYLFDKMSLIKELVDDKCIFSKFLYLHFFFFWVMSMFFKFLNKLTSIFFYFLFLEPLMLVGEKCRWIQ